MSRPMSALIACYLFSIVCSFSQSRVNLIATPGLRDVRTSANQPVANGNSVWIGSFAPGFNVAAFGADPVALLQNWDLYGATETTPVLGQPGRFISTSSSMDPSFNNQKIWLWIFKTQGNTAPVSDFSNVTEWGLFASTLANWVFPAVDAPFPSSLTDITSSEVNQAVYGAFDVNHLYLASPIPEPSALHILLAALGIFASVHRLRALSQSPLSSRAV